jgi:predicted nucleic acid-binding protein
MAQWFRSPSVTPLNPGTQHIAIFRNMLAAAGVAGNLVTDAHIAALAIEHQAEVHSNDSDFARFPGLRWRNPL